MQFTKFGPIESKNILYFFAFYCSGINDSYSYSYSDELELRVHGERTDGDIEEEIRSRGSVYQSDFCRCGSVHESC